MPLKTLNPPSLRRLDRVGVAACVKELEAGTAELLRRQMDDYSVFEKPDGATWAVCGLKLGLDILTFPSREEATARGNALARTARVSLWFEPTGHHRDSVLLRSFRDVG